MNIPMIQHPLKESLEMLTLQYWPEGSDVIKNPENIHAHAQYFESMVVKGGYTHELYDFCRKTGVPYDLYLMFTERNDKKSFSYITESYLKFVKKNL